MDFTTFQINADVDAVDVECRDGFSLLMKASNGAPMYIKTNPALKMIESGIAVPVT